MKKRFMLYLFTTIALTSSIITLLIGAHSKSIISRNIENIKNDISLRLENQFNVYDNFLLLVESELKDRARTALLNLSSRFSDYEITLAPTIDELKKIASANGVDEIYFINKKGVVYNTSFPADLNFNLMNVIDFGPFLKTLFNKNEITFHRISNSTLTGVINLYAYFSPAGSDYIIEVSINVNKYLNKIKPDFWQATVNNIFHSQLKYVSYLKHIDVYTMNDGKIWSFINEGKTIQIKPAVINQIFNDKEAKAVNDNLVTIYKSISFDNKNDSWSPAMVILEMNFDFEVINNFETQLIIYSFIVCAIIILISFVVSSKILNNYITARIIKINGALKEVAEGNYSVELEDRGGDEITEIASNINLLSATISKHVSSLEDLMPICALCKKIRDDKGYWEQVESYLLRRSGIKFSHGMCPECTQKYYPQYHKKQTGSQTEK